MSELSPVADQAYPGIFGAFAKSAERHAERTIFSDDGGHGRVYTYAEALETVLRLAAGLQAKGLVIKPEIGLLSENRSEWPLAYLAILAAGGTVVPIDANLSPMEIAHIIGHANLQTVFASEKFEKILGEFNIGLTVISFEKESKFSWQNLLQDDYSNLKVVANQTAVLIYTSGTTGTPKAVELTHENLLGNLEGILESLVFEPSDVFLSVLPLHHTFEATCGFLSPVMAGASIVYARSLKSKEILEDIDHNKVTIMAGVPLLYEKIYHTIRRKLQSAPATRRLLFSALFGMSGSSWKVGLNLGRGLFRPLRRKAGLESIRMFVSGGAPLSTQIARFFNLIGFTLIQGYGLTETSPVLTAHRPDQVRFGSVGSPISNVEIRIDQPDKKGVGEIIARGPNITPGYRNNAEETAALIKDGWLYTGDLGRMKKGQLWITGRKKNLIVSAAGKNIYPEEIEEKLLDSPYVSEAVVFGRHNETTGREEVWAVIVPDREQFAAEGQLDPDKLRLEDVSSGIDEAVKQINQRMADYKRIVKHVVQLEELEKTSTKKVKRFAYK